MTDKAIFFGLAGFILGGVLVYLGCQQHQAQAFEYGAIYGARYTQCVALLPSASLRAEIWRTRQYGMTCADMQRLRAWEDYAPSRLGPQEKGR